MDQITFILNKGVIEIIKEYKYKARDANGVISEGKIEAESKQAVANKLKDREYYPIKISALKQIDLGSSSIFDKFKKIKTADLVLFCRQFATMMDSGLSMVRALNILSEQTKNHKLREAIISIRESVESGSTLSEAMEKQGVFSSLLISMIEAGEAGGVLAETLSEMAEHYEKENAMKQNLMSALAYPVVILIVAIFVVFFLILFVLPQFVEIFSSGGMELPIMTVLVLSASEFISKYWYIISGLTVILIYLLYRYYQSETGRRRIDWLLLKVPLFGDLIIKLSVARFSKTMGVLVSSGVSILESFTLVANIVGNTVISENIKQARKSISEGESIAIPLGKKEIFPTMALQMIRVGEETGSLDDMLYKVADFYEQEVQHKLEAIISLIEPAMIVFLGIVVGGVILSVIMPMFNMIGQV